ncbi:MAG: GHKL domain-containing protein [Firmicutes bacterium]|nr:GHKL domain-containing protein [Bacillota bacterium]
MAENFKNIDFLIHDINNVLFSISGMILNGQTKRAEQKIKKLFGAFNKINKNFRPIDYLIKSKLKIIDKLNIKYKINQNISFPKIDEAELCIIFGNILDNAIESCYHNNINKKIINIKFIKNKSKYIYIISNFKNNSENIKNNRKHLGLKIIKQLMQKDFRNLQIQNNKKVFKIQIKFIQNKKINSKCSTDDSDIRAMYSSI